MKILFLVKVWQKKSFFSIILKKAFEKMNKQEIIDTLKAQYSKELRKQLVQSLRDAEQSEDDDRQNKLMNQIFSYVLAQLGWTMASNIKEWDNRPLEVMQEVFPKIHKTKWYKEQKLLAEKSIDVQMGEIE